MIPKGPCIMVSLDSDGWPEFAANAIRQEIDAAVLSRGVCNIMLTGGGVAERLYKHCCKMRVFPMKNMCFFFGDERCVPPDHNSSNYAMVMRTLLAEGISTDCSIVRMEADNPDREEAAKAYEKLIPDKIDVLLLGVGEDGHIASLFPNSSALLLEERSVVPIIGPKEPQERLTITPRVIASARSVFVVATGETKGRVLAEALKPDSDLMSFPVGLTFNGTWLLDADAGRQLKNL